MGGYHIQYGHARKRGKSLAVGSRRVQDKKLNNYVWIVKFNIFGQQSTADNRYWRK